MKFFTTFIYFNLLVFSTMYAQVSQTKGLTNDGLEIGVHGGHFFATGNVDAKPGFAAGVHLRKSLDYIFSLRLDLMAGQLKGEDAGNVRNYTTDWYSGSLQGIVTLNNLRWSSNERKTNLYALGGIGVNRFSGTYEIDNAAGKIEEYTQFHFEAGVGIAFKITDKVNLGIEHKVFLVTSENADKIDGISTFMENPRRFTFRDVPNYTNIRLNFNLGQGNEKTQPMYWLNPLESIANDVQLLKDSRVTLADDDSDGIINQLDEEQETPKNAPVNTKGVSVDSDKDGVADYLDKEPFSPVDAIVDEEGVAVKKDMMEEVEKMLGEKMKNYQPKMETQETSKNNALGYLPFVYFAKNSSTIKNKDYGVLANVASAMAANSDLKFVVTGHTDQSGSEAININLSYERAKNVVDFLVKAGVSRSQLILQYQGKKQPLVEGEATVNRRVGFTLAEGDSEMNAPVKN